MKKDDSGLEEEFEYFWEAHVSSDPDEREEDRWWNPGPPESSSGEDEVEVQYLTKVFQLEPEGDETGQGKPHAPARTAPRAGADSQGLQSTKPDRGLPRTPERKGPACKEEEPARTSKTKRRKLRKKVTWDEDYQWESARQDAWLRGMLTDSSGSESEEKYTRFAESGRWIAEMTGIQQQTTTSRGECSGQEKLDSGGHCSEALINLDSGNLEWGRNGEG
jgi:hypothetical protein